MMNRSHNSLFLCLDFSGTLSSGASNFANTDEFNKAVHQLGITENSYWQIVNQSWERCGRGDSTLYDVLIENIGKSEKANSSVTDFIKAYNNSATIDSDFKNWLNDNKDFISGIAICTDFYNDMNEALMRAKNELNSILNEDSIWIINSADIGAFKSEQTFWYELKKQITAVSFNELILIDDFGAAEVEADSYVVSEKVKARKDQTQKLIRQCFPHTKVDIIEYKGFKSLPTSLNDKR